MELIVGQSENESLVTSESQTTGGRLATSESEAT